MAEWPAPGLEALFRESYPGLVRALTVGCGDPNMAEDAVMDAFVQAQRHWARIASYDNPAAWVRRVAIRRLFNRRRDLQRRLRFFERAANEAAVSPSDPSDGPADGEVTALLKDLAPHQRIAAALYYLEDLPVSEVAVAMHVSESTVKTHLRRAREHLGALLEVSDR